MGERVQSEARRPQRGIQSVEVAIQVLLCISNAGQPLQLSDIVRATGMSSANAHAYLVSFVRGGLVRQSADNGRYWLGPLALQLGLAALNRLEPVTEAAHEAEKLAEETELGVTLAVWGNQGPAVVRFYKPSYPIHVAMNVGSVLSVTGTVTGRVFAAYMPKKRLDLFLNTEPHLGTAAERRLVATKSFAREMNSIREAGYGRGVGTPIPGINSLCAPVLDAYGAVVVAMTLLGPEAALNATEDGDLARRLVASANTVSIRLGYGKPPSA